MIFERPIQGSRHCADAASYLRGDFLVGRKGFGGTRFIGIVKQ
jgi:hypothetical protein